MLPGSGRDPFPSSAQTVWHNPDRDCQTSDSYEAGTIQLVTPHLIVSTGEPIVQTALQALAGCGIEPQLMGFGSLTDCVHLINHSQIPTINLGADIESAHLADEFVTVEQLIDLTKTIALSIMRWSGVRESAGKLAPSAVPMSEWGPA